MRAQASPSSPLPSTLACLTTFPRTLGVEEEPASPCSWKAWVRVATRAALLRATTDWRDFRAGQGPLRPRLPPSAFPSRAAGRALEGLPLKIHLTKTPGRGRVEEEPLKSFQGRGTEHKACKGAGVEW